MERTKAVFNWSGGKDSAHALWRAIESQRYSFLDAEVLKNCICRKAFLLLRTMHLLTVMC